MIFFRLFIFYFTLLFSITAFSISFTPGGCGTLCLANNNGQIQHYPNSCISPYASNFYPQLTPPWNPNHYANYGPYAAYSNCYNCNTQNWGNNQDYGPNTMRTWQR